jgi:hypothetical protein
MTPTKSHQMTRDNDGAAVFLGHGAMYALGGAPSKPPPEKQQLRHGLALATHQREPRSCRWYSGTGIRSGKLMETPT